MYKFPVTCKYTDSICGTIAIYDSREMLNILKNCVKNCILYAKDLLDEKVNFKGDVQQFCTYEDKKLNVF